MREEGRGKRVQGGGARNEVQGRGMGDERIARREEGQGGEGE